MKPHLRRQIPASDLIERLNPDLQEKVRGRYMVTTLSMAIGLSLDDAVADHNAHLGEISRRDSLTLDEITALRALAGNWSQEYTEAWAAGFAEGRATAVLRILQSRGIEVTGNTWEHITACSDLSVLSHWLDLASTVTAAEQLFTPQPSQV
ncbi:hypothetical protein [Streptomyces sp. NBC_01314]|uniref:hypothetical protein n=1 Tax=Streptomyces sp. NBC_01314 TaxID=2903821 RepID=UPI0030890D80|nr:hypothetical protein OG622_24455 [Streptomyces sp. NBC_01314]